MNEVSLKPVIEELENLFSKFNTRFFDGGLEKPVITVSPDHTRGAYGWCTGWKAWKAGEDEGHYNTSIFRQMMKQYKDTGEDVYFDIQVTNEDPTSSVGRQTVILKDCNIDGGILTKFDADAEYLDEDMDFTFEDFEMPEAFTLLAGME